MFMMMMITNALPSQSNGFGISPLDLISSQEKARLALNHYQGFGSSLSQFLVLSV